MIRCCAAILLVFGCSHCALARDWYVNNIAGDDSKDGLSEVAQSATTGPVRTIAKALRGAQKMDRIILAKTDEPYRESFTLCGHLGGYPEAPFTILGNGAVLDGSQPIPADAWEFYRGEVYRFLPKRMPSQMIFLDGKPLKRGGQPNADGLPAPLAPMEWTYLEGYVYFRPEAGRIPEHYNLTMAAQTVGITLYQVQSVDIQDLVVQGFQLDGVNAHDSAFDARLAGLTCRGNGRSGISVGGASQVLIEGCLVGDNGEAQVRTEGYSHSKLTNCTLLDNTAPPLVKLDQSDVQEVAAP